MKQNAIQHKTITWLVDLDNTLHNASHAIFPALHSNMNAYIANVLGDGEKPADTETVDAARSFYWKKYGATLLGLVRHHNVNPFDFLHQTHHFDGLAEMMRYESGLKNLLNRLPGSKILFTNAPRNYSQQVVRQLGLHRHFDQHISIEAMRVHGHWRPKPSRWLLKKLLAKKKLAANRCILIEDNLDNLRSAKQCGLKTVWVTQYAKLAAGNAHHSVRFGRPRFVNMKIHSMKQLPSQLSRFKFVS